MGNHPDVMWDTRAQVPEAEVIFVAKVWLITCNCRTLVRALAEGVLASGHKLVATAVDAATVADLAERYGDRLRVVPVDVTSACTAETAIQATLDAFGRLDVLVLDVGKWRTVAKHRSLARSAILGLKVERSSPRA
jgi:NADP-dependent 3-hydroxy acid dehydrogenase YdfG